MEPNSPLRTAVDMRLSVESPMPDEKLHGRNCCFMFRAEVEGNVEASVDGGSWTPCRYLMGYWWLDWESKKPGQHRVVARIKAGNGADIRTEPRKFHFV